MYIYRHDNTISIILISRKPARLNNGNVCVHDYSVHVADRGDLLAICCQFIVDLIGYSLPSTKL